MKAILECLEVASKYPLSRKTSLIQDIYQQEISKALQEHPSKSIEQALLDIGARVRETPDE